MNSDIFKPSLLPDKDKTEFIKQVQQEYKHIGSIKYDRVQHYGNLTQKREN